MSEPLPRAQKRFGQHFLEPAWVARVIDSLRVVPDDTFLEIGPGRGALTRPLAPLVRRLVAVEIDRTLAGRLAAELPDVKVVEGDFLDLDLEELLTGEACPVRVVGNLPYNVSSPILFKLLKTSGDGALLGDATLMLQKEVVDRIVAAPGSGEYGVLSVQVAALADVQRVLTLPPGAFRPPPKVTSAVVHLRFRPPQVDVGDRRVFETLVRGVFLQRRKTMANALKPVAHSLGRTAPELLVAAGVDPSRRPETVSVEEFGRLSRAVL